MEQIIVMLKLGCDEYYACILASFLTILSSSFSMWCILDNCLGRANISRIIKGNYAFTLLFLPIAKRYVAEYKKTYFAHSVMYCISLIRIPILLLWIYEYSIGSVSLLSDLGSFLYLLWNIYFLGIDMAMQICWDLTYDSQYVRGKGKTSEKVFSTAEASTRLKKYKEIYLLQKEDFALLKMNGVEKKAKNQLLRAACTAQAVQAWIWYLAKTKGYSSEDAFMQDMRFLFNEWEWIQQQFEEMDIKRDIERYTDCFVLRDKYLCEFEQIKAHYLSASEKQKQKYFSDLSNVIYKMIVRIYCVYNCLNEIDYSMQTILQPSATDIIHLTEEYRKMSLELSESEQEESITWIEEVRNDLNRIDLLPICFE